MSMNINGNLSKLTLPTLTIGQSKTEVIEEILLDEAIVPVEDTTVDPNVILDHMASNATNNAVDTIVTKSSVTGSTLQNLKDAFKKGDIEAGDLVKELIKMGAKNVVLITKGTSVNLKFTLNGVEQTLEGKDLDKAVLENNEKYFDPLGEEMFTKYYDNDGVLIKEIGTRYSSYFDNEYHCIEKFNGGVSVKVNLLDPVVENINCDDGTRIEIIQQKDVAGRIIKSLEKVFDKEGRLTSVTDTTNDYVNNILGKVVYNGKREDKYLFEYDSNGNVIGHYTSWTNYDKKNKKTSESFWSSMYNSSGKLVHYEKFEHGNHSIEIYDNNDRCIYYNVKYKDGGEFTREKLYNEEQGNLLSEKETRIKADGKKTETTTEYLEDGTKTVKLKVTDVNGKVVTDVIETYNAAGKLISRVDNSKALINLTSDEFDGYGDGSFVEAGSYTKNSYSGESNVRANAVKNVKEFIDQLSAGIAGKDKYDKAALNYAKNMTKEFFEKVINAMSAHSGVSNGAWTGKTGSINLSDGTTFNSISYNQESHQGYIDAKKNCYDGDNLQWTRGTMAGARFAKITIKADYIIDMFIQFYNSYAAKNQ